MTRAEAMIMLADKPNNPALVTAIEVYLRVTERQEPSFIDLSQPREHDEEIDIN